ncbi:sulfide/dihydroorotate dehydrogenase-like FAD/NAD-binding protein [Haliovirga abyssi]|uniref:Ferredoxin-NADP+ reductase subunit alpha n=1 Tax=Haliovirga abyssi TaxID=2996794 RepID=A0AAU9DLJ1_9FUSO|nr:sulfide/dihydroorotate dehydrogenase-like FAD/NAD-binding protein [Haliovirga abyssi]BDU51719.1 ferredoxin-NADP+ reductase subunit alpha [Haliovirga abyssi]
MHKIIEKEILNSVVEKIVVEAPFVARKCEPGQFVIIRVEEDGERIPLTIADYNREDKTVTLIYQVVGYTTKLLSEKNKGDFISDVAGPLGKATKLEKKNRVLGIAGGVGAAPLYPQIRKLNELGVKTDIIIGGRSKENIILEDEFRKISENIYFATNDGSEGTKGFVTDVLNELIKNGEKYDEIITIGPVIMMKAVVEITKKLNIPTSVSLNPIMIDGTGMCGGCRVKIGEETKFACVDGPDFDGFLVDFDGLMRKQTMFKEEEQEKDHKCKIGLD